MLDFFIDLSMDCNVCLFVLLFSLELDRSLFIRGSAGFILFKGWGQSPLSAGERKVLIASQNSQMLSIQVHEVA